MSKETIYNFTIMMYRSSDGRTFSSYTALCDHQMYLSKTPMQKLKSVEHLIPIQPDVSEKFWESNEEILPRNYEYLKFMKHRKKKTVIQ